MKRKPILLAFALLLVVGAALWGVNYRLDHPPLTKADKEFRALVAGADSVSISQLNSIGVLSPSDRNKKLNATQTRQLIEKIRFLDKLASAGTFASAMLPIPKGWPTPKGGIYILRFSRKGESLARCLLFQSEKESGISCPALQDSKVPGSIHQLNPRFNKRLNRVLDAYLPQRIRP